MLRPWKDTRAILLHLGCFSLCIIRESYLKKFRVSEAFLHMLIAHDPTAIHPAGIPLLQLRKVEVQESCLTFPKWHKRVTRQPQYRSSDPLVRGYIFVVQTSNLKQWGKKRNGREMNRSWTPNYSRSQECHRQIIYREVGREPASRGKQIYFRVIIIFWVYLLRPLLHSLTSQSFV